MNTQALITFVREWLEKLSVLNASDSVSFGHILETQSPRLVTVSLPLQYHLGLIIDCIEFILYSKTLNKITRFAYHSSKDFEKVNLLTRITTFPTLQTEFSFDSPQKNILLWVFPKDQDDIHAIANSIHRILMQAHPSTSICLVTYTCPDIIDPRVGNHSNLYINPAEINTKSAITFLDQNKQMEGICWNEVLAKFGNHIPAELFFLILNENNTSVVKYCIEDYFVKTRPT